MTRAAQDLAAYEAAIVANASHFVAFVQVAPGDRRRAEIATAAAAIKFALEQAAATSRKIMVYAVAADGRDTLYGFAQPDGRWVA